MSLHPFIRAGEMGLEMPRGPPRAQATRHHSSPRVKSQLSLSLRTGVGVGQEVTATRPVSQPFSTSSCWGTE